MSKIIVNGAFGKMGMLTANTIETHPDHQLVARLGADDSLADAITQTQADIVIDLTNSSVGYTNTKTILSNGARPVVGTSGFLPEHITELSELATNYQLGGVIAPNLSIGAVLMMQMSAMAARHFKDCEVIEMHHEQKLDAPSGTALKTCDIIAEHRRHNPAHPEEIHEPISGSRGARHHDIPIHAIRLPGHIAHQQVLFGGPGEVLTIRHDTISREAFMPGIILACEKVMNLKKLVYGLEHLID